MGMDTETSAYSGVRKILQKYGMTPSKRLGQNFLVDKHVLDKIVAAADLSADGHVLEIGAGLGALTRALAEKAGFVTAVELDRRLAEVLRDMFAQTPNVDVIQGDIMKLDMAGLLKGRGGAPAQGRAGNGTGVKRAKIAANLPYYITTPVIARILESGANPKYPSAGGSPPESPASPPLESATLMVQKEVAYPAAKGSPSECPSGPLLESATLMVQKEVAERITAAPGSKSYGAITVAAAYRAERRLNAIVPRNCFFPRPDVDSAVITLKLYENPPVKAGNEKLMLACVKAAFGQRRKTLLNCLSAQPWIGLGKDTVADVIKECGFRADARGETLGVEEFAALADRLTEAGLAFPYAAGAEEV